MAQSLPAEHDRLRPANQPAGSRLSSARLERLAAASADSENRLFGGGPGAVSAALEACQEELRDFLYAVTHDLRGPLVNAHGWAGELRYALQALEPLMSGGATALPAGQQERVMTAVGSEIPEALDHIEQSIQKIDGMMGKLVELSRACQRELEEVEVDLDKRVAAIIEGRAEAIADKRCALEIRPLPRLRTDPHALEDILSRLIDNAVAYLDPQRPGKVTISAGSSRGGTEIVIADNGRGIAEKDLPKIFAPFRRGGKRDTPGEGIGLTMAQALARRLGGHVESRSVLGEGSRFALWLPTTSEADPSEALERAASAED